MNPAQFMRFLILALCIFIMAKGFWLMLHPISATRVTQWWINRPAHILKLVGGLAFLFGLCCIWIAVTQVKDSTISATLIIGTLFMLSGVFYATPVLLHVAARPLGTDHPTLLRICGGVSIMVGAVLLWVLLSR